MILFLPRGSVPSSLLAALAVLFLMGGALLALLRAWRDSRRLAWALLGLGLGLAAMALAAHGFGSPTAWGGTLGLGAGVLLFLGLLRLPGDGFRAADPEDPGGFDQVALLREAQSLAHLGSWSLDLLAGKRRWSKEMVEIVEQDPAGFPVSPEAFMESIHPEDRERVRQTYAEAVESRQPYEVEYRFRMADGRIKHVVERGQTHFGAGGRPARFVGTLQDLTDQKTTEEVLRQRTEALDSFFALAPDLLAIATAEGRFLKLNDAWRNALGWELEDLYAHPFMNYIHPEDSEGTREAMEGLAAGRPLLGYSNRYRCKDGSYRWIEWKAVPHGARIIAAARDITDRKRAEAALRESEAYQRLLFADSRTPLVVMDAETSRYLDCNEAAVWIYGYARREDVLGLTPMDVSAPTQYDGTESATLARSYIQTARETGSVLFEWRHQRPSGEVWDAEVQLMSFDHLGRPLLQFSLLDITTRRRIQAELTESERMFREVLENVGLLAVMLDAQGRVTYANPALLSLTGWAAEDVVGGDWFERFVPPEQGVLDFFLTTLESGAIEPRYENDLLTRSGERRRISWSNTLRRAPDGRVLGTTSLGEDVTDRRAAEEAVRQDEARLRALMGLHDRSQEPEKTLIEYAIESAVSLTDSQVGYLHFVREDQQTLQLVAWSQTTLERCTAAKDEHYSLDRAGVWADCVRLRRPVIHNDYPALPERRGLPEGHFPIRNHLSVPIFDGERIVAVAGVGNRDGDYTERDARQLRLFVGGFWNLVRRKRAEDALRKLTTAVEQSPSAIVITDTAGTIEYVNPAFTRITGYSAQEALGQNPRILKSGELPEAVYRELWETLRSGQVWRGLFHNRRKDGQPFWEMAAIAPIFDPEGRITHYLAVKEDVTERKRAEEALQESEERWHFALEGAGDGLWDWNLETDQVFFSRQWKAMLGYEEEEIGSGLGEWKDRVHPEDLDEAMNAMRQHLEGKTPLYIHEYRVRCKDGTLKWILDRGKVMARTAEGRPARMIGTHSDISERKRAEAGILRTYKLESLAVLAGGIAHDFNNLFTAALGHLDIAELEVGEESPLLARIGTVRSAVLRAAELSRRMLAYSGMGRFNMEPLDLNHVIQDQGDLLRASLPAGVDLRLEVASGPLPLEADHRQLQQVLEALVTNAGEAMAGQAGEVTIRTRHERLDQLPREAAFLEGGFEPGLYAVLEVVDPGCGIEPEVLPRIFDPFFSTKFAGRGLSLAVVQGILRAHRAGARVESEPGHGSRFTLWFPSFSDIALPGLSAVPLPDGKSRGRRILLVDDEAMLRESTSELLESFGYDVLQAADGLEGVEAYRAHAGAIGLVLLDLTMPRMDGREAFLAIKEMDPQAVIVLSSGWSEQEVMERLKGQGVAGFLQKPYRSRDLEELVRRFLEAPGA